MSKSADKSRTSDSEKAMPALTVSRKLFTGLSCLIVLGFVIGGVGLYYINSIEDTLNGITDIAAPTVETSDDLIANIWESNKVGEEIIADEELSDVAALAVEFAAKAKDFDVLFEELKELVTDPELLKQLDVVLKEHKEFMEHGNEMISLHTTELEEEILADEQLEAFDVAGSTLVTMLDEFAIENEEEMAKAEDEGDRLEAQGTATVADLNAVLGNLFENEYPAVEAALKLQLIVVDMESTARRYLAVEDPTKLEAVLARFNELAAQAPAHFEVLERLSETEEDMSDTVALVTAFNSWVSKANEPEQLFDTQRDMLQAEAAADEATEQMESDADRVAAALNIVAEAADAISDAADETAAEVVGTAQTVVIFCLLLLFSLSVGLMFVIRMTVIKPINLMTGSMQSLAGGDMDVEVPALEKRDEIGAMAKAVQVFKENAIETERLREEQAMNEKRSEAELKAQLNKLAQELNNEVQVALTDINGQAEGMKGSTAEMNSVIERLNERTTAVSDGASQANGSIQTVASATEELSASINEITRQVDQSSSIAQAAAKEAASTDQTVGGLAEAAEKIGDVINMIQDIAEQTNLLALNATIEAARAGEAGKGFAVVAAEVKNLANQTGKATVEISSQIGSIRNETDGAVKAIRSISDTIKQINDISDSITEAVGQQSNATQEISASVQNSVEHMTQITSQITDIASETDEVRGHSGQVLDNANTTSENVTKLDHRMAEIMESLRVSGNRRQEERVEGPWNGKAMIGGTARSCSIVNLSTGGALVDGLGQMTSDEVMSLSIEGLGTDLKATVIAVSPHGAHLNFDLDESAAGRLRDFLGRQSAGKAA